MKKNPEQKTDAKKNTSSVPQKAKRRTKRLGIALAVMILLDISAAVACFTILFVRPAGGFGNAAVTLVIPELSGLSEERARQLLATPSTDGGEVFALTAEYRYSDTAPRGTVLSQSPAAGSRRKATPGVRPCRVTLTVSLGVETADIPDLAGKSLHDAEAALAALGFTVRARTPDGADALDTGEVLSSEPPAGTGLAVGKTVTLTVKPAAVIGTAVIPDLTGLSRNEAEARLTVAGFLTGEIVGGSPFGNLFGGEETVVSQQYAAGTRMKRGTAVGFTLRETPVKEPFLFGE